MVSIEIYADGADLETMKVLAKDDRVTGFTTNPTLVKKAGVTDYRAFAKQVLEITDKPVSFEVFSDDLADMKRQALEIHSWGNVFVKVPIINTKGESTAPVISYLTDKGVKVNVTAVLTKEQVGTGLTAMYGSPGILSIFAGRIADTGRDPTQLIRYAVNKSRGGQTKILWASTREVLNVMQAEYCGCDIITCSPEIIAKLKGINAELNGVSLATVKQFHNDAQGYAI